jgi:ATP-dependent DNA helicase RecG
MTPAEIEEVFREESSRVEWKESDKDTDVLLHAVCALANDLEDSGRPAYVALGVRNNGTPVGLGYGREAKDKATLALANKLSSTKLQPHPSCTIAAIEREGALVFVVSVHPYPVPPVVRVAGVVWVRVGTQTKRATDADVRRLEERRPEHQQPFDLRPVPAAKLDDLDLPRLRLMHLAERDGDEQVDDFPDLERWLAQRELVRMVSSVWVPNAAAVLLYGISPQTFFPGAIVELVRYDGTDFDAGVSVRKTVTGSLPNQLDVLWTQMAGLVRDRPLASEGIRTPYGPEYPLDALKELVRNMVQHRSYAATNAPGRISWFDDRIVFTNPGGPFGQAGEGEFGEFSDYRNPTITRGLVDLGYVERLGRGVRILQRQLDRAGHAPLEVETDGYTTLTVRRRP